MKKILAILFMTLMCVGADAQYVTYSKELVDKAKSADVQTIFAKLIKPNIRNDNERDV